MMKSRSIQRRHEKRGSILVITAFSMVALLSFVALVTDIGYAYYQKARIESAVNAGWKAGLDLACVSAVNDDGTLTTSAQTAIQTRVRDVVQQSYPGISFTGGPLSCSVIYRDNRALRQNLQVVGRYDSPMFFAKLIGYTQMPVAAARGGPEDNGGEGVIPIGVPHGKLRQLGTHDFTFEKFEDDEGFTPGEEYIIRLGNLKNAKADDTCTVCGGSGSVTTAGTSCTTCGGDGHYHNPSCSTCGGDGIKSNGSACNKADISCATCGGDGVIGGSTSSCTNCGGDGKLDGGIPNLRSASNHGSLDMGSKGGGASDYEEFFKFGYPGPVSLGDLLYVKTGTMKGPNDDGRDYRIDNDLRRVVVPIVKCPEDDGTVPQEKNGSKDQVVVIGFAIFDLLPVNEYSQRPLPYGLGAYDPSNGDSDQVREVFVGYLVKPS